MRNPERATVIKGVVWEGFLGERNLAAFYVRKKCTVVSYLSALNFRVYILDCVMHNQTSLIPTELEENLKDEKLRVIY